MYTVQMIGLEYFYRETDGSRLILCPNGTNPAVPGVPAHHASFFIEHDDLQDDDWWPDFRSERQFDVRQGINGTRRVSVWEFRIPESATVTINGSDVGNNGDLNTTNLDAKLPKLGAMDPRLVIDPTRADTIAQLPIRRGRMELFGLTDLGAAVQLTVEKHNSPITITAITDQEQATKKIFLRTRSGALGTEMVFANTFNLFRTETLTPSSVTQPRPPAPRPTPPDPAAAGCRCGCGGCGCAGNGGHTGDAGQPGSGGNGGHDAQPGSQGGHAEHNGHFQIFGRLDVNRRADGLRAPGRPTGLAELKFRHSLIVKVLEGEQIPGTGCVPSCC